MASLSKLVKLETLNIDGNKKVQARILRAIEAAKAERIGDAKRE